MIKNIFFLMIVSILLNACANNSEKKKNKEYLQKIQAETRKLQAEREKGEQPGFISMYGAITKEFNSDLSRVKIQLLSGKNPDGERAPMNENLIRLNNESCCSTSSPIDLQPEQQNSSLKNNKAHFLAFNCSDEQLLNHKSEIQQLLKQDFTIEAQDVDDLQWSYEQHNRRVDILINKENLILCGKLNKIEKLNHSIDLNSRRIILIDVSIQLNNQGSNHFSLSSHQTFLIGRNLISYLPKPKNSFQVVDISHDYAFLYLDSFELSGRGTLEIQLEGLSKIRE